MLSQVEAVEEERRFVLCRGLSELLGTHQSDARKKRKKVDPAIGSLIRLHGSTPDRTLHTYSPFSEPANAAVTSLDLSASSPRSAPRVEASQQKS
jgi:hypothetical protein